MAAVWRCVRACVYIRIAFFCTLLLLPTLVSVNGVRIGTATAFTRFRSRSEMHSVDSVCWSVPLSPSPTTHPSTSPYTHISFSHSKYEHEIDGGCRRRCGVVALWSVQLHSTHITIDSKIFNNVRIDSIYVLYLPLRSFGPGVFFSLLRSIKYSREYTYIIHIHTYGGCGGWEWAR